MKDNENTRFLLEVSSGDNRKIVLGNKLFQLTLCELDVWINGRRVEALLCTDKPLPVIWTLHEQIEILTGQAITDNDDVKVELETIEAGRIIYGNKLVMPAIQKSTHSKRFLEFLHKSYDIDFVIDAQDIRCRRDDLLCGYALEWNDSSDTRSRWMDPISGKIHESVVSLIKEIHPEVLRFRLTKWDEESIFDVSFQNFLQLCSNLETSSHIVLDTKNFDLTKFLEIIRSVKDQISPKPWWQPKRIWELSAGRQAGIDDQQCSNLVEQLRQTAESIKAADPDGILILPAADPRSETGRQWNERLLQQCINVIDQISISRIFPGPKGWVGDDTDLNFDLACGLPAEFEALIRNLSSQIDAYASEKKIPVAVTPWSYFKQPADGFDGYHTVYTKQDAFYFASVMNRILRNTDKIGVVETGFLFGPMGLIESTGGKAWKTAPFHFFGMIHSLQNVVLNPKTIKNQPIPSFNWTGIPGIADPQTIPYLDILASRSEDGTKLFLLVLNRHPRKRALVRFNFMNLADMHPIEAKVLRTNNRNSANTVDHPDSVFCKEIALRDYKFMDHVNLDIAPAGIAAMLLSSRP
ncbi:MAG: alpha-L-arabinofuranosidase C-terminal domain-containing protein [Flexilinea sp.]